ncbi:hypothetical protein BDR26DRAFT_851555 [Obelidium mucronatum]|nr:hypothetical protein BDR26DRAFT_851555 [Obelidium mucronatum]
MRRLLVLAIACFSSTFAQNNPSKNEPSWTLPLSIEWDSLRNYALNIKNPQCQEDILDTLDEANLLLNAGGLSTEFFAHMSHVLTVSGDDKTASDFRSVLIAATADLQSAKRGFVPHPDDPNNPNPAPVRGIGPPKVAWTSRPC